MHTAAFAVYSYKHHLEANEIQRDNKYSAKYLSER